MREGEMRSGGRGAFIGTTRGSRSSGISLIPGVERDGGCERARCGAHLSGASGRLEAMGGAHFRRVREREVRAGGRLEGQSDTGLALGRFRPSGPVGWRGAWAC